MVTQMKKYQLWVQVILINLIILLFFGEGKVITINKLIKRLEELMSNYNITEETTVTYEDAHTLDDIFINYIFVIDNSVVLTD